MPALAASFRPGDMRREMLLGEPVLLGRNHAGEVFALRDICPHRGVPLSAGRIKPDNSVECPYHGWRFRKDGVCSAIPSLVPGQDFDPEKIKVRRLCGARTGWTDLGLYAVRCRAPRPNPSRRAPASAIKMRWTETQTFRCGIDHAVIGLMDPAHGPYVHAHWWWKKSPRVKEKHYAPLPNGFVMTRHKPSKPVYSLLGDVETGDHFRAALHPLRNSHRQSCWARLSRWWASPSAPRAMQTAPM